MKKIIFILALLLPVFSYSQSCIAGYPSRQNVCVGDTTKLLILVDDSQHLLIDSDTFNVYIFSSTTSNYLTLINMTFAQVKSLPYNNGYYEYTYTIPNNFVYSQMRFLGYIKRGTYKFGYCAPTVSFNIACSQPPVTYSYCLNAVASRQNVCPSDTTSLEISFYDPKSELKNTDTVQVKLSSNTNSEVVMLLTYAQVLSLPSTNINGIIYYKYSYGLHSVFSYGQLNIYSNIRYNTILGSSCSNNSFMISCVATNIEYSQIQLKKGVVYYFNLMGVLINEAPTDVPLELHGHYIYRVVFEDHTTTSGHIYID